MIPPRRQSLRGLFSQIRRNRNSSTPHASRLIRQETAPLSQKGQKRPLKATKAQLTRRGVHRIVPILPIAENRRRPSLVRLLTKKNNKKNRLVILLIAFLNFYCANITILPIRQHLNQATRQNGKQFSISCRKPCRNCRKFNRHGDVFRNGGCQPVENSPFSTSGREKQPN